MTATNVMFIPHSILVVNKSPAVGSTSSLVEQYSMGIATLLPKIGFSCLYFIMNCARFFDVKD